MTALHIDWTRCDGHGLCNALLPQRFGLDEWGFPIVHESAVAAADADADADDVRRTVAACPSLALYLDEAP